MTSSGGPAMTAPLRCKATISVEPAPYGFRPVQCGQVVGIRGYWAKTEPWENTDHFATYCALEGHQANVRRRFAARTDVPQAPAEPPEPRWLHEDPNYDDPLPAGSSWTLA
jgi:hypothetical protein